MVEEEPQRQPKFITRQQDRIKLTQSEKKRYKEYQFHQMFVDKACYTSSQIGMMLGMSPKVVNKLMQRIRKTGTVVPSKNGKPRKVTREMITYLKEWFKVNNHVGKSFKYAYDALVQQFQGTATPVRVSVHGCYKAFRRYTNYTYKRV